jgi:hypothetical protein
MLSCSGMFTFLVIFVIGVLVVTRANQARATGGRGRGGARRLGGQQTCPACGEAHPPFAQFCRRCGRRLP